MSDEYTLQIDPNISKILAYPLTNNLRLEYLIEEKIWQVNNENIGEIFEIEIDFESLNLDDNYILTKELFIEIQKLFKDYIKKDY